MNVIVFGATGTIGKEIVTQALQEGYQVTAFCRNPEKITENLQNKLKLIKGDVLNLVTVATAIQGQDIVCIAIGSGKNRKSTIRSVGTKNIIAAMKSCGVKRLICQTTLGTGESKANLNFFWKHIMFGWYLKEILLDHELQEKYVMQSGLEWTIVRPGAFSNGKRTQVYRHGFKPTDKSVKLKISRADVADFILKQFTSKKYMHQTPGLSY